MKIVFDIDEIDEVSKKILETFPHSKCFAFYAEMGTGKTTLINALCKQLGVRENTSSPTFSIINQYKNSKNETIYHTDWYRLKDAQEAINSGVQDILDERNTYCFIEWPELAEEILPHNCIKIKIDLINNNQRVLETF